MEETPEVQQEDTVDPSHQLDLEIIFEAQGAEAEMEAIGIKSILDAGGIPAVLVGSSSLPNLPFAVQVPHDMVAQAQTLLAEARAAGPAAADEAERATEV